MNELADPELPAVYADAHHSLVERGFVDVFWDFTENAADSARSASVDDTVNKALTLQSDVHHDGNGVVAKECIS